LKLPRRPDVRRIPPCDSGVHAGRRDSRLHQPAKVIPQPRPSKQAPRSDLLKLDRSVSLHSLGPFLIAFQHATQRRAYAPNDPSTTIQPNAVITGLPRVATDPPPGCLSKARSDGGPAHCRWHLAPSVSWGTARERAATDDHSSRACAPARVNHRNPASTCVICSWVAISSRHSVIGWGHGGVSDRRVSRVRSKQS
jgi:hypothetical protein